MTRLRLRRYFRHGFFPQLLAFEACARHGSVTRAAGELSLAQPTALGRELLVLCEEMFDATDRFDERREAACAGAGPADRPPQRATGVSSVA